MNFCPSRLFVPFALGVALAAGSVRAQQTINFTRPFDPERAGQSNVFRPLPTERILKSAGDYDAPKSVFGASAAGSQYDVLPGSPAGNAVSPAAARAWQKILEDKKNWPMMTPAQIFGVTTPEKILGISDPNHEENLSPGERYLRRLDREAIASATNSHSHTEAFSPDAAKTDLFGQSGENSPFARTKTGLAALEGEPGKISGLWSDTASAGAADAVSKSDFARDNPFGLPAPLPKQTPEQLAGMDRFRALMEPSASVDKMTLSTRPSSAFTPLTSASPAPAVNPAGHSYTPLNSNLGRPAQVKPLSGLTAPDVTPTPKPAVQLPPWLMNASPNGPLQQRF
jgi:hypothetical protein